MIISYKCKEKLTISNGGPITYFDAQILLASNSKAFVGIEMGRKEEADLSVNSTIGSSFEHEMILSYLVSFLTNRKVFDGIIQKLDTPS